MFRSSTIGSCPDSKLLPFALPARADAAARAAPARIAIGSAHALFGQRNHILVVVGGNETGAGVNVQRPKLVDQLLAQ